MAFFQVFPLILALLPTMYLAKTHLWPNLNFLVGQEGRVSGGFGSLWTLLCFC